MGASADNDNIRFIWFDENIKEDENKKYFEEFRTINNNFKGYSSLDDGFRHFYKNNNNDTNKNEFRIIFVIVSGRLFGRYIKKLKENINKIINIPYTYIFTSTYFKPILLKQSPDINHILSYDTIIEVNNGFYNPGGVYDNFEKLIKEIKIKIQQIDSIPIIRPRRNNKLDYEGVLTFIFLEREEDLLAPALYKDIITKEEITEEDCKKCHNYILSFKEKHLSSLIKNLDLFKYIPFEILCKYWARCYTIESDFYKSLNHNLMKAKSDSEMPLNYKTFIKMLYTGVEKNSLKSFSGKKLFRGSLINKEELETIKNYKSIGKLSTVVVFSKAFLSFSENKNKAESYCIGADTTKLSCLFILENNNINLHESNANIQNFSAFPEEKEVLFFPGTSFIIKDIKEINDNKIEIILNNHGKFKEKYSLLYEDDDKINNLINKNEMTKNISGKDLCFLKNGKYLKLETMKEGRFCSFIKGKDLETEEIVCIKQLNKEEINKDSFEKEANILKNISEKIKYSCKLIDYFEAEKYIYTIITYYDGSLERHLKKIKKNLPPNLIKKIFEQLNLAFKELLENRIAHRNIMPGNILIKYSNEEKTNFDSILNDYGISKEYGKNKLLKGSIGDYNYMAPEVIVKNEYQNNCDLFSIGLTIYYLYFGKLPFNRKKDGFNTNIVDIKIEINEDKQLEDLIKKLLKENPDERITWEEYFNHPFFKQYEY